MHEISMIQPFGYIDNREKMHLLTPALLSDSLSVPLLCFHRPKYKTLLAYINLSCLKGASNPK